MTTNISYTYYINTDFKNANNVNISALQALINNNPTFSENVLYITSNLSRQNTDNIENDGNGEISIFFQDILHSSLVVALNGIISEYIYVEIPKRSMIPGYDSFVSNNVNYPGDYTSISEAFNDNKKSVYVKSGIYIETDNIIIPNGGQLFGETPGSVVIVLNSGNSVIIDGSGEVMEEIGEISIISNTSTINGVGTTFTNLIVTDLTVINYILLGTNYYEILNINSDTQLILKDKYVGISFTNSSYRAHPMHTGTRLQNIILTGSSRIALDIKSLRHGNIKSIAITQCNEALSIINCSDLSIHEVIPTFINNGIMIKDSVSISFNTISVFNSKGYGATIDGKSNNIIFQSCAFENNSGFGLKINDNCELINVINNVIKNNNSNGVEISHLSKNNTISCTEISNNNGIGLNLNSKESIVSNCMIISNNDIGLVIGEKNTCDSCIISDNKIGISILNENCIVSNNNIYKNNIIGLNILSNKNIMTGNIIKNSGIYLDGVSNVISNNRISDTVENGLFLSGNTKFNIINSNIISNNEGNGLELVAGSDKNIITSNILFGNTGNNYIDNGTGTLISLNIME